MGCGLQTLLSELQASSGGESGPEKLWSHQLHWALFLRFHLQTKPTAQKSLIASGLGDAWVPPSSNFPEMGSPVFDAGGPRLLGERGQAKEGLTKGTPTSNLKLSTVLDTLIHVSRAQRDKAGCGKRAQEGPGRPRMCTRVHPYMPMCPCMHAHTRARTHRHTHTVAHTSPQAPAGRLQLQKCPSVRL